MDTALAKSMVEQFAEAGVLSVVWTGGGEPTLHRDFNEIIEHTSGTGLKQGIYTHGGHITEERADLLKRCLTWVYVSLDEADPVKYQKHKRVNRFKNACDGIERLARAEGDATVGVGFLIGEHNWQDHNEMIKVARRHGADYVQFRPTILYDMTDSSKRAEDITWLEEALPYLEALEGAEGVEVDIARFKRYQQWESHGYKTCHWSALQSVVTPNGKMWTCVNKREYEGEEIGDLSVESFADIWARHKTCAVNGNCRILCRGDVANQALDALMTPVPHSEFV